MEPEQLAVGKILISEPFLTDPNFHRTVILLLGYSTQLGAQGVVINKPLGVDMQSIISNFPVPGFDFHFGGPVSEDQMIFIHDGRFPVKDTIKISQNLCWSGDFEDLKSKIARADITKDSVKFFGGYSGWEPGQLESELSEKAWIVSDSNHLNIFQTKSDELWKSALKNLGKKYAVMAEFPENPAWN